METCKHGKVHVHNINVCSYKIINVMCICDVAYLILWLWLTINRIPWTSNTANNRETISKLGWPPFTAVERIERDE